MGIANSRLPLNSADIILNKTPTQGTLFLGSIHATSDNFIKQNNINVVISMIRGDIKVEKIIHHVYYLRDSVQDNNKFQAMVPEIAALIDFYLKANLNVLVHCRAGIHRSPAVVVHYLQIYKRMSLKNAVTLVRTKRPIAFFDGSTFDLHIHRF